LGDKYKVKPPIAKTVSQTTVLQGLGEIGGGFLNLQDRGNKMMDKIIKSDDFEKSKSTELKKKKKKIDSGSNMDKFQLSEKIQRRNLQRTKSEES